jgi:arginine repressor
MHTNIFELHDEIKFLVKRYEIPDRKALWRALRERGHQVSYRTVLRCCRKLGIETERFAHPKGCTQLTFKHKEMSS